MRLAGDGVPVREIVARLGVSKPTVIGWKRRYAAEGIGSPPPAGPPTPPAAKEHHLRDTRRVRHDLDETILRLCVLDDPARRAAYLAVRTAGRPLTRAEVADEVGISVRLAAFHLEKLLSEGFLEATYERDERSVGVGHPAKRYRPTRLELEVSIPPRRYDLAAEILAEALEADSPDPPLESLADAAAEYGRQVGRRARTRKGGGRLLTALNVIGYEPATSGGDVVLRNCPFHHLAQARPEIICQMNLAFVAGVLAGTQSRSLHAVLSPSTGRCCVVVTS